MEKQKSGIERLRNNNYLRTIDYYLIVPILLMTIIGLYVLNKVLSDGYEAYPGNFYRQVAAASLGMFIALLICLLDTQFMRIIGWIIYGISLFLLVLVLVDNYDLTWKWGADSWLNLPVIGNFQPSELAKIGLVMAVGDVFERIDEKRINPLKGFLYVALIYLPPMLLILKQPDFGTAMVIIFSFVCICHI